MWAWAAPLDQAINAIWFFGVFFLPGNDNIHLASSGLQGADFALDAAQKKLRHIAEIKPNSAPVWATIFSDF